MCCGCGFEEEEEGTANLANPPNLEFLMHDEAIPEWNFNKEGRNAGTVLMEYPEKSCLLSFSCLSAFLIQNSEFMAKKDDRIIFEESRLWMSGIPVFMILAKRAPRPAQLRWSWGFKWVHYPGVSPAGQPRAGMLNPVGIGLRGWIAA